jgi:hypothetical protein
MPNQIEIFKQKCDTKQLKELAMKYPWWGAARMALHERGEVADDSIVYAAGMRNRLMPATPALKAISPEEFRRSQTLDIIDSFLAEGEHKIVIDEQTTDSPMDQIDLQEESDDEFVSEELAEIYAKQHLFDLAIEIYEKLSLQDSQKSVYFAELIEGLKKQRLEEDNKK